MLLLWIYCSSLRNCSVLRELVISWSSPLSVPSRIWRFRIELMNQYWIRCTRFTGRRWPKLDGSGSKIALRFRLKCPRTRSGSRVALDSKSNTSYGGNYFMQITKVYVLIFSPAIMVWTSTIKIKFEFYWSPTETSLTCYRNYLLPLYHYTCRYYSATIIKMSGVGSTSSAIWLSSITAAVNCLFTFVGFYVVDRVGRRYLTIVSLVGRLFVWSSLDEVHLSCEANLLRFYYPDHVTVDINVLIRPLATIVVSQHSPRSTALA